MSYNISTNKRLAVRGHRLVNKVQVVAELVLLLVLEGLLELVYRAKEVGLLEGVEVEDIGRLEELRRQAEVGGLDLCAGCGSRRSSCGRNCGA
jgi:hypothetical protein